MKRCIVNLIDGKQRVYVQGQNRLIEEMRKQDIPLLYFIGEQSVLAPPHKQNPFAFKLYAIQKAIDLGFQQIFWVDASVYPVKNIMPIFDRLTEQGIFIEDSGHQCGHWMEAEALRYFSLTKDEAIDIDMISAGFIGYDFSRQESKSHFTKWWMAMEAGVFRTGNTIEHRSEQAACSVIAYQLGLMDKMSKSHTYFCYVGEQYGQPNSTAPFHLQGF